MGKLKLVVLCVTLLNINPSQIFGERYTKNIKSNQKTDTYPIELSPAGSNLAYDYNSSRSNKSN